jgi:predicted transcriptional regulator
MKTIIKVSTTEEFFKRGKEIARLADQGKPIPMERIISFEDPQDLASLITAAKLVLFREVKSKPGSITDLSQRLHRDRSAVKRDVDELERFGLVEVEEMPFPGHGRRKEVRAVSDQVLLAM